MMLCLTLLTSLSLMAQQQEITGTVVDVNDNSRDWGEYYGKEP